MHVLQTGLPLASVFLLMLCADCNDYDFCHSDPRLQVVQDSQKNSSWSGCSTGIFLPILDENPNHALHDRLWALSHYMKHCQEQALTLVLNDHPFYDLSLCGEDADYVSRQRPPWGICVVFILARWHRAQLRFEKTRVWPHQVTEHSTCYSRQIWMGILPSSSLSRDTGVGVSHFRKLSWFGRNCEMQYPCIGGLAHLPDSWQTSALNNIISAVRNYTKVKHIRTDAVNVLIYDRNDTKRRKWAGAQKVLKKLESDKRLHVKLLHQMPMSFLTQVKLFTWADIFLSPHGAAIANTIFMQSGSDVLEIMKNCDAASQQARFAPWDWTGWHAHLLGLNLVYLRCTALQPTNTVASDAVSHFTVNLADVLEVVEHCIKRQLHRRKEKKNAQIDGTKLNPLTTGRKSIGVEQKLRRLSVEEFLLLIVLSAVVILSTRTRPLRKRRAENS